MSAGDIKGDVIVIPVTAGATVAIGDIVHLEADGKYDPVADGDTGKFGVALDAGSDGDTIRIVIYGKVRVTATAAAIPAGGLCMAGNTGKAVLSDNGAQNEVIGTAMAAVLASAEFTLFVGLVA